MLSPALKIADVFVPVSILINFGLPRLLLPGYVRKRQAIGFPAGMAAPGLSTGLNSRCFFGIRTPEMGIQRQCLWLLLIDIQSITYWHDDGGTQRDHL
jgi:hypothetical protein